MYKALMAAALALLLLEGCSLGSSRTVERGKVSISWDCVRDLESDTQTCRQRRMRNGIPVDDEVLDTLVIAGNAPPPAPRQSLHHPPSNAGDAVPWNRQPLATVNAISESADLEVENLGPEVREGRKVADIWGGKSKQSSNGASPPASRYTLQLAAFSSPQRCDLFITRDKPGELAAQKRLIANKGKHWCIVTHGDFDSRAEAVAVSKAFGRKYPDLSFWVRSRDVIRELEVSAE